jgi:hypothetical protein
MTDTTGWQRVIAEEAPPLLTRHEQASLEPVDAYRLLILLGRAEQLRVRAPEVESVRARAARTSVAKVLADKVSLPDEADLLAELETALEAGLQPEALHSLLLDVDDLATVLELLRDEQRALALGRKAAENVAGAPRGLAWLAPWAKARLATLAVDSAIAPLWKQVARQGFPARRIHLPALPSLRQAAASFEALPPVSGPDFELYEWEGHWILWMEVPSTGPWPRAVELWMHVGEREGRWSYRVSHSEEGGLYVDLGTPGELRQRAAQALGELPTSGEHFELSAVLTSGETDESDALE